MPLEQQDFHDKVLKGTEGYDWIKNSFSPEYKALLDDVTLDFSKNSPELINKSRDYLLSLKGKSVGEMLSQCNDGTCTTYSLQVVLGDLGCFGDKNKFIDGLYGHTTKQGVKNFQRAAGLTGKDVDGILGPITLGKLEEVRNGTLTLQAPESNNSTDNSDNTKKDINDLKKTIVAPTLENKDKGTKKSGTKEAAKKTETSPITKEGEKKVSKKKEAPKTKEIKAVKNLITEKGFLEVGYEKKFEGKTKEQIVTLVVDGLKKIAATNMEPKRSEEYVKLSVMEQLVRAADPAYSRDEVLIDNPEVQKLLQAQEKKAKDIVVGLYSNATEAIIKNDENNLNLALAKIHDIYEDELANVVIKNDCIDSEAAKKFLATLTKKVFTDVKLPSPTLSRNDKCNIVCTSYNHTHEIHLGDKKRNTIEGLDITFSNSAEALRAGNLLNKLESLALGKKDKPQTFEVDNGSIQIADGIFNDTDLLDKNSINKFYPTLKDKFNLQKIVSLLQSEEKELYRKMTKEEFEKQLLDTPFRLWANLDYKNVSYLNGLTINKLKNVSQQLSTEGYIISDSTYLICSINTGFSQTKSKEGNIIHLIDPTKSAQEIVAHLKTILKKKEEPKVNPVKKDTLKPAVIPEKPKAKAPEVKEDLTLRDTPEEANARKIAKANNQTFKNKREALKTGNIKEVLDPNGEIKFPQRMATKIVASEGFELLYPNDNLNYATKFVGNMPELIPGMNARAEFFRTLDTRDTPEEAEARKIAKANNQPFKNKNQAIKDGDIVIDHPTKINGKYIFTTLPKKGYEPIDPFTLNYTIKPEKVDKSFKIAGLTEGMTFKNAAEQATLEEIVRQAKDVKANYPKKSFFQYEEGIKIGDVIIISGNDIKKDPVANGAIYRYLYDIINYLNKK